MNQIKYYYRFNGIGYNCWDIKEVLKYNQELINFDDLSTQFAQLKDSYENATDERADIMVCVLPDDAEKYLNSAIEITVCHIFKRKFFSKEIIKNDISICITVGTLDGVNLYSYNTVNFDEIKQIFYDYIVNQKVPNTSSWEVVRC